MPSPITINANMIDLTGNPITGYMVAAIVSPSGVYDLYVSGTGIIAPKLTTSSVSASPSVQVWGNDEVVDMADSLMDTYYTVTIFNTSNQVVWTAAYSFTGSGPIDLVGYPSLTVVPPSSSSFTTIVSSLNSLVGALSLTGGAGVTITSVGDTITVGVSGASIVKYSATFTSQTSLTVTGATHGLGTADLIVAVYDSDIGTRNLVTPNSVSIDSSTFDVTVTFGISQSGRIVMQ